MSISWLITSDFTDFHLNCTRWYRSTLLNHVGRKCQCCWRGNYKRQVIISLT